MTRYTVRPASRVFVEDKRFADEYPVLPDISVSGPRDVNTGLIDASGNAIYRLQAPVGFGRDDE